jgi:hypothetical protein
MPISLFAGRRPNPAARIKDLFRQQQYVVARIQMSLLELSVQ